MHEHLITAQQLADDLQLPVEMIWRYTWERRIPAIALGARQYRYDKAAVLAALAILVREEETEYGQEGRFTYEDYLQLPEEVGFRYEVLEGYLVREPSPSVHHQRVSRRLQRALEAFFMEEDPTGELFNAPLDVTLTKWNVVQPDLIYVAGSQRDIVRETRIDGPPELVVEVLSPSHHQKDRLRKLEIYRKAGIPHYWIADPEEGRLEAFRLKDGYYRLVATGSGADQFAHPDFPPLVISMPAVFVRP